MKEEELLQMQKTWAGCTPSVMRWLERWDHGWGILFVSRDSSGDETAPKLAAHLGQMVIAYLGECKHEWVKKVRFLEVPHLQGSLFQKEAEHICILVHEIEKKPAWMLYSL